MKYRLNISGKLEQPLKTEYPLCEKDEQALQQEAMRKLQYDALKLWHSLKKKIK